MHTDKQTKNGQINRRNYTNFDNLIGQSILESGNKMLTGQTNEQMELHQFRKQPGYDGDLSSCQVFRVWKQKCRQTDGRRTHQSNRRVGYTQPA